LFLPRLSVSRFWVYIFAPGPYYILGLGFRASASFPRPPLSNFRIHMSNNFYNHNNQHLIMNRSEKAEYNTKRRERYQQKKLDAMIKVYNAHMKNINTIV